jgi:phage pi2 protein 07
VFPPKKRVFTSKYTYEMCKELSKDCKTRSDFQEKYSGAFKYLKKNNLLDKLYPKKLR